MFTITKRPAPAKKTNGYDVTHTTPTRRVYIGFARTKREAESLVATGHVPGHPRRK